jgi:hypothetical protein
MHHFEFALRDFANTERHCTPQSTILIHDTYPLNRVHRRARSPARLPGPATSGRWCCC